MQHSSHCKVMTTMCHACNNQRTVHLWNSASAPLQAPIHEHVCWSKASVLLEQSTAHKRRLAMKQCQKLEQQIDW